MEVKETDVPAGNSVGKSFLGATLIHWFLQYHTGGMVLATAPTQVQLEEVLWKEVEKAYNNSRIPLGGRLLKNPLKIDMGGEWKALAYSTTKTERLSGHHSRDLFVLTDEASGVPPEIREALDSCNPSRELNLGNPLRPDGWFYDRCMKAEQGNPDARLIRVSSLESPDIHLERSPRGLADAGWLRKVINDYGKGSIWWDAHVLALFPGSAADTLIPREWLDRAERSPHTPGGFRRLSIDLAKGNEGDKCVIWVRDDNGILACEFSNRWNFEQTADRASVLRQQWGIEPSRVTFDQPGLGEDFGSRLKTVGLVGATPFRGGNKGGPKFENLRAASAWQLRQRLDPERMEGGRKPPPFAIRSDWMQLLRPELQALTYSLTGREKVVLMPAKDWAKAVGHSPDFAASLIQSFAFPSM